MPYSEETYLLCMCVSLYENLATVQQKLSVTFWGHHHHPKNPQCMKHCVQDFVLNWIFHA